ncbi:sensor histidine kinase [Demequina flava]|uniref:sensor histidine kinase n=1 Tax=Demequina flava TaxID=1095025 RepID=UPI0007802918|nr:HAMP domain-containing sensor histidine kinase [Demequina flava]
MSRLTRRAARVSVRARIGLAVALLTGLGLLSAGLVASAILTQEVESRVDDDLVSDVAEFERLAEVGVDPATGEPFESPAAAVRTSMERLIPDPNQGVVGFLDGELEWISRDAQLPLQDDPDFLAAVAPATSDVEVTYQEIVTDVTTYHVAVAPVRSGENGVLVVGGPGDGTVAALVMAYDLDAEVALFQEAFRIYGFVAFGAWIVVSVLAWALAGRLLRPIKTLAETASHIGRDDLSERIPVTGSDDVSDMTEAVNGMLDRLEAAFRAQADLLNDVSHELRTPITVVRGHLELMDVSDPADTTDVRDLSIDELDRMTALVTDLLTLAKADRPDFITLRATDIADLTHSVLDKASAMGDRSWVIDAAADAVAMLDKDRITQAWLQLVANAVRFSDPGSEVGLGARVADGEVHLWVRDQGVGVPKDQRDRIFSRFVQADPTRQDGSGLGLSIVTAIMHAHGGSVAVDSREGHGSTFTMSLPTSATAIEGEVP